MRDDARNTRMRVTKAFTQRYGGSPDWLVRAPGRVNLIGDHTDYNDGFVLPMALERDVWIALRRRSDRTVLVHSLDFAQESCFDLTNLDSTCSANAAGWPEYVKGSAWVLQQQGYTLRGWEGVVAGDVPLGAGLSSSAALELAALRAFTASTELNWSPADMALLGQRAENEWVGVACGIMDQLISAAGQAGHALLIDCRSLETLPVPIPLGSSVMIMDTGTRRGLVDSAYNERRRQCEAAARFFDVSALRDVDMETFSNKGEMLDERMRKRARHVVTENERTLRAAEALQVGDSEHAGRLMNESHASLRDDFEVSSRELDLVVRHAQGMEGCYGARMTGAGFGGCAVALIETHCAPRFARNVAEAYLHTSGYEPTLYLSGAAGGASIENYQP